MSQTSAPSPSESEPSFPSSQAAQAGCKDTIHHLIHLKPRESTTYRQQLCGASSPRFPSSPTCDQGMENRVGSFGSPVEEAEAVAAAAETLAGTYLAGRA